MADDEPAREEVRRMVLESLARSPSHADELQHEAGSFADMIDTLGRLLEEGLVERGPDHMYRLTKQGRMAVGK